MIEWLIAGGVFIVILLGIIALLTWASRKNKSAYWEYLRNIEELRMAVNKIVREQREPISVQVDMQPIHKIVENIPNKVLQSITSSTNIHKGALGELIGYVQLHAQYDRIIPLGSIVDFVCIKFPTESCAGQIDFVDVKTGSKSRLSKDQRELQRLIEDKQINFVKLKVETTI